MAVVRVKHQVSDPMYLWKCEVRKNGEGCLYISRDKKFLPVALKGLRQKKVPSNWQRAPIVDTMNVQSSSFRWGYSINHWKKSCPLITVSFDGQHSAHRSDSVFLLSHTDKRKSSSNERIVETLQACSLSFDILLAP